MDPLLDGHLLPEEDLGRWENGSQELQQEVPEVKRKM